MQAEEIRVVLLSYPEVTEETPFDAETVVYKTAGKMFALTNWNSKPLSFNLKCDPEKAEVLREQYRCVLPGYHMSKKHWNTVIYDGSVEDERFKGWIEHSFECVVKSMPRKVQADLLAKRQSGFSSLDEVAREARLLRDSMRKGI